MIKGVTSQATWDDNFSEYKPFSIICAQAGSPTTKYAELVVTIKSICKHYESTGRICMYGSIYNASNNTIFVSEISARVLAVALSTNPIESYSVLN